MPPSAEWSLCQWVKGRWARPQQQATSSQRGLAVYAGLVLTPELPPDVADAVSRAAASSITAACKELTANVQKALESYEANMEDEAAYKTLQHHVKIAVRVTSTPGPV